MSPSIPYVLVDYVLVDCAVYISVYMLLYKWSRGDSVKREVLVVLLLTNVFSIYYTNKLIEKTVFLNEKFGCST